MNKLERQHLADYLEKYNEWRRDPRTPSGIKMPNPTELGMMIDLTIKELRGAMENTHKTGFISLKEQHTQQKEKKGAWIEWNGGAQPVGDEVELELKMYDTIMTGYKGRTSPWFDPRHPIKAYRVVASKIDNKDDNKPLSSKLDIASIEKDNINPDHYKVGGIETWDYLKAKMSPTQLAGFALGNVIKYISRADHKNKLEDLKKSKWYLDKIIIEIEKGSENDAKQ